jgi:uncharacterized secreted repeat protein (TIGR03808 family)
MQQPLPSRRCLLVGSAALMFSSAAAQAEALQPSGGDDTEAVQAAIVAAAKVKGALHLGGGTFNVSVLTIKNNVTIIGSPGATKLFAPTGGKIFSIRNSNYVVLQGLGLSAKGTKANILSAEGIERLVVEDCDFSGAEAGMRIASCGGRVVGNRFQLHEDVALQSIDSKGLLISGNRISDIGNCGIQVWQTETREDNSIVTENYITRIAAKAGGNGQNGNGINVFKAGNVTISNNRISDCAFTGIRNNSGPNAVITSNSISRCNEVALFVEFNHDGSVVADNMIDTAAHGIKIVNFDAGGRLSQCTGNVVRNLSGVDTEGLPLGGGILCEADVIVANNIIDTAQNYGIRLGWGPFGKNLQASNNTLIGCRRGIEFSVAGEGPYIITNNVISGATLGAVVGMNYLEPVTTDLTAAGEKLPATANVAGNMIRN